MDYIIFELSLRRKSDVNYGLIIRPSAGKGLGIFTEKIISRGEYVLGKGSLHIKKTVKLGKSFTVSN